MRTLLAVLWAATLAAQPQDETRNPRTSPEDVAAGARTFRSHCSPCHGMNAEGGRGPRLAEGRFYHGGSDAALLRNISDGIPGTEMPGLFYSPDRVWQVVAYLRTLSAGTAPTVPGDLTQGLQVYQSSGCPGCHRLHGEGGRQGPDLTFIGQSRSAAHLRQAVLEPSADVRQRYWMVRAVDRGGQKVDGFLLNEDTYTVQFLDRRGELHSREKAELRQYSVSKESAMPSYQGRLTEHQLADLIAYLASLRPAGGTQ